MTARAGTRQQLSAFVAVVLSISALCAPSYAQLGTVHADLPLWTGDWDRMSPYHFTDEDEFGCATRMAFGDWRFDPTPRSDGDDFVEAAWMRITNYGVFHCYAIIRLADEKDQLEDARFEYGFLIDLGTKTGRSDGRELWALQIGMRTGSDYLLLARRPDTGLIRTFDVLSYDCPKRFVRDAGPIDIMGTGYCAINTRRDLIAHAKEMARRPAAGTLVWDSAPQAPEAADDEDANEDSQ